MKLVVQRVRRASVCVDGKICGEISHGLLVLLGVEREDTHSDVDCCVRKLISLRIFSSEWPTAGGRPMDRSLVDVGGSCLVVSQFTLAGRVDKGRRPSFDAAESPERARALYEEFVSAMRTANIDTQTGVFGAHMDVELLNDGPVTILIRSRGGQIVPD